jgi:non-ribosomal peptide synthetase component F
MTLLDIFEAEVLKSPDLSALVQENGRSYSYKNLNDIAGSLGIELACAIAIAPVDTGRDETPLVAVMMNRGVGLVSAILGILKAGAGLTVSPCHLLNLIIIDLVCLTSNPAQNCSST